MNPLLALLYSLLRLRRKPEAKAVQGPQENKAVMHAPQNKSKKQCQQ